MLKAKKKRPYPRPYMMCFEKNYFVSTKQHQQITQFFKRSFSLGIAIFLLMAVQTFAQQTTKTVRGTVRNENGQTMSNVSVIVKGLAKGTTTDTAGHYIISANGDATLVFSYVGLEPVEEKINNRTNIDVAIKESGKTINEVVVIGYATVKRRDLTGSVASVGGKELAAVPVPNIAQAMQGKMAGVNVTTQDGRPGGGVNVRVRGGASISQSNQALVLIDGMPGNLNEVPSDQVESVDVLKDASASAIYGSRGANGVILVTTKSAKAGRTSLTYNGYAKINTPVKYLEALKPYDYLQYVWANAAANGASYQTPFEQLYGLGANAGSNTGGIDSYKNLATVDIQKDAYSQSTSWNHALTLTGGTDKTKILFAATYNDEQGMKLQSYQKRATAQFRINQKVFNNVTFDLNIRYANINTLGDESVTSGGGSILSSAYQFRPIATNHILGNLGALTASNNISQYGKNVMWDSYSPVARISDYDPLMINDNFVGIAGLNWEIIKGLNFHTELNGNKSWSQRKYWSGAIYNAGYTDDQGNKLFAGNADYRKNDSWGTRWSNTLSYDFKLPENHKLNVLAGMEVFNSGGTGITVTSNKFPSNFTKQTAFAQIQNGLVTTTSSVNTPDRLSSYFGRVMYNYKEKYFLTGTFRADGSSRFAGDNRWGYFPGGAFAWRASQENFLKNVNWVNELKVRVAYGAVGNNNIPSGVTTQSWGSVTDPRSQYSINHAILPAYQLSTPTVLSNPDLKWETTVTRDIGTDFSLFGNKLSGTVDVYWNSTKDVLLQTTIPGITGFTYTYDNIGQTSNKGIEISLLGTLVQNHDWRVMVGGNITFNKNNVDKLADNVTGLYGSAWNGSASYPAYDYQLVVGQSVGLVRGLVYDGYYKPSDFTYSNGLYTLNKDVPDLTSVSGGVTHGITTGVDRPTGQIAYPGLPKYKDLNHDGKIDDNDLGIIGHTTPKFTGGFNISVNWKSFDLGMNFNYSVGNDVYNANKLISLFGPKEAGVYQNKLAIMANSYKIYNVVNGQLVRLKTPDDFNAANTNANLPLSYSETGVTSTLGIEDGSFLRFNTLTLGYTIPKSALAKIHVNNLRVFSSIYNVFTITSYKGMDPEVGTNDNANSSVYPTTGFDYGAYPRARSFVFGVNVNF
jgi:TonB-linked SusC/RagA family outer membrane protein